MFGGTLSAICVARGAHHYVSAGDTSRKSANHTPPDGCQRAPAHAGACETTPLHLMGCRLGALAREAYATEGKLNFNALTSLAARTSVPRKLDSEVRLHALPAVALSLLHKRTRVAHESG